jgi:hypothetical protein
MAITKRPRSRHSRQQDSWDKAIAGPPMARIQPDAGRPRCQYPLATRVLAKKVRTISLPVSTEEQYDLLR